ncbi:MAG: TraB/GumN family protein, partial [Ferruginibacter sp.]
MKLLTTLILLAFSIFTANGQQPKKPEKKYQSLLWEISGNGLTRPSYLFGTMHVSNKLAFHLADSFYSAIRSADVVALETNPANWQDDYSKPNIFDRNSFSDGGDYAYKLLDIPNDYIRKNTFALNKYESKIKLAMATEPAMINGMLYRTYNQVADFEEDTYLDMYIFQTGSKLGKKLAGVENFEESQKLVAEAYKDAAKEKRSKKNDVDYSYDDYVKSPYSIEDAYRKGDLDMLDSLEMKQLNSKAFLEKFLYKRNEI